MRSTAGLPRGGLRASTNARGVVGSGIRTRYRIGVAEADAAGVGVDATCGEPHPAATSRTAAHRRRVTRRCCIMQKDADDFILGFDKGVVGNFYGISIWVVWLCGPVLARDR